MLNDISTAVSRMALEKRAPLYRDLTLSILTFGRLHIVNKQERVYVNVDGEICGMRYADGVKAMVTPARCKLVAMLDSTYFFYDTKGVWHILD